MLSFKQYENAPTYDYIVGTDGACKGNPGKGTWAFVVFCPLTNKQLGHKKGHSISTTNNEQELTAIVKALEWATRNSKKIHIKTDSAYCLNGITKWLSGWVSKGWKTASGESPKNLELWQEIHVLWDSNIHKIEKVKGHSGNLYNEAADMYCNEEYLNAFV